MAMTATRISEQVIGNGGSGGVLGDTVDPITGSIRVSETDPARFGDVSESLIDDTDLASDTYYYPSSAGIGMLGFNAGVALTGKIIEATTGDVTITVEATDDEAPAANDWIDVTPMFEFRTGVTGNVSVTVTNGTAAFSMSKIDFPFKMIRIKVVVTLDTSNTVIIKMLRKAK